MIPRLGCRKAARGMDRTGLRRLAILAALCTAFAVSPVVPASAQIFGRNGGPVSTDGEPTDPEGAFPVSPTNSVDVSSQYGLSTTPPGDQTQVPSWIQAIVDLLQQLGLFAGGVNG